MASDVDLSMGMKLLDGIRLPIGLSREAAEALVDELEYAEEHLPRLGPTAIELAELAMSGEFDATVVGAVLERDGRLRDQVLRLANSAAYAPVVPIESSAGAAQRIGLRALWEIAVVDVARAEVFGPVIGQVLGGDRMWTIARTAGVISHRLSAARLGERRASVLAGVILCSGPPLAHQVARRVERRIGAALSPRVRRELSNRTGPALASALVRAWSLSPSIEEAARTFADGRGELPADSEAQIAVFAVTMARYASVRATDDLSLPLRGPTASTLGITHDELRDILDAATRASEDDLPF
ncbi:MAG: HDOD domain-containing protein [Planctomycetota bacterium]